MSGPGERVSPPGRKHAGLARLQGGDVAQPAQGLHSLGAPQGFPG